MNALHATLVRGGIKTSVMLALAAVLGVGMLFAAPRATPIAHAARNPTPSYSCIHREQVSDSTLYFSPYGTSGGLVTATIWELAYYNPQDGGFYVGCNMYFAQAYFTSNGLQGNGAVWFYDAKTGKYLASAPTPVLYGSGYTQSGYTNTMFATDGPQGGVTAMLGFKPVGGSYLYYYPYGPFRPF